MQQRLLVESLGGSFHSVIGDDIPDAVLDFARAKNATQIVIGASRRNPVVAALTGPGTGMTITRRSGTIDVHVVSHDYVGKGRVLPKLTGGLTRRAGWPGWLVAAVLLARAGADLRRGSAADLSFGSDLLLFLLVVVICSLVGGFWPALAAAVAASVLLNYFFAPPLHTFTISEPENILALVVFVLIAVLVSRVVDQAARRNVEAARSNAEAETLSTLAGSLLRGEQALPALLQRVAETFAVSSVALLRQVRSAGLRRCTRPARALAAAGRGRRRPVPAAGGRRRRGAGRRRPGPGAARPPAGRRGPADAGRVRHRGGRGLPAAAAVRGGRRGPRAGRDRPGPDRAAQRGQPRPAHPDRLGQGGGVQPAQRRGRLDASRTGRSCSPPPTRRWTG